jgi:ABC-type multidrug transport system fused ATPase/permease subunit
MRMGADGVLTTRTLNRGDFSHQIRLPRQPDTRHVSLPSSFSPVPTGTRPVSHSRLCHHALDARAPPCPQWINCVSSVLGPLTLICIVNPWFLCALPVIGIIYGATYTSSAPAMRELQRLEALSKSPIYTQFSETLNGLSTIRAFGATTRFYNQSLSLVKTNTDCLYNQDLCSQWVRFLAVSLPSWVSPKLGCPFVN